RRGKPARSLRPPLRRPRQEHRYHQRTLARPQASRRDHQVDVHAQGHPVAEPTHVYCFWRSDPAVASCDIQLTFTPASSREGVQGELEREPGMTVASWQQRPESKGYVRLRSSDPFEAPLIQPNYLALESDRRVLLAAMKLARRLLKSKPLEPYYEREDFPGP